MGKMKIKMKKTKKNNMYKEKIKLFINIERECSF